VAFTPDGRTLVSGGHSDPGSLRAWDLAPLNGVREGTAERACAMTGRGLSTEEWERYITGLDYFKTC
jgi:hypothetical protein